MLKSVFIVGMDGAGRAAGWRVMCLIAFSALLGACGGAPARSSTYGPSGQRGIPVVAAENFYGDIAAQIGGPHISVTSILTDPNADPHLFEPDTSSGLAVAKAKVVLQNGLGYDAFMRKLEDAAPSSGRATVTMADVPGVHGKDGNPHPL